MGFYAVLGVYFENWCMDMQYGGWWFDRGMLVILGCWFGKLGVVG